MTRIVANRKAQIITEATRLFSKEGFDRVTIKALADACGITEPALYRHFKSKQDIYNSVLDAVTARLDYQTEFDELAACDDVMEILQRTAHHILNFFGNNEDAYRLLMYCALGGHEKARLVFRSMRVTYVKFLKDQLDRLFERGVIVERNNEITARCFVGMVFDCALTSTIWRGFHGAQFTPDEVIANNIPIYARGLVRHVDSTDAS